MKERFTADMDLNLSEESIKHVEAGAAAHRKVVELAARLQEQLQKTEHDLKLANLDLDHLRIVNHDLTERLEIAEGVAGKAVEARIAYETLINLISHQLSEFVPVVPPSTAYREPSLSRKTADIPEAVLYGERVAPRPVGEKSTGVRPGGPEKPAGVHDRWGHDDSPESASLRHRLSSVEREGGL